MLLASAWSTPRCQDCSHRPGGRLLRRLCRERCGSAEGTAGPPWIYWLLRWGDGIALEPPFVTQAGAKAANGTFASDSAFNLGFSTSVEAAQFIRAYSARYPGKEYLTPYTAAAYDAAMVLITAIKQLIQAGQPVTRAAMLEQVQHIQYAGVIGPISFDENGDITHGVFTMYTVQAGQWVYFQQLSA
jgi:branched-chain amino acid transport system substrate-binding protein